PSNRTIRPDDSVFAVKPLRSCPVGLVDASPVIGMNQLEPEFGIILKTFAAPAAYFFESRAYIVDRGAVGSRDEKYFPDVFRQLAESLFALAQLSFDKLAFDAKGNTIGHGGHCIQGVLAQRFFCKHRHHPDESFFDDQRIAGKRDQAFTFGPFLVVDLGIADHRIGQVGLYRGGDASDLKVIDGYSCIAGVWVRVHSRARLQLKHMVVWVVSPDTGQRT